jgi:hypothetical protein
VLSVVLSINHIFTVISLRVELVLWSLPALVPSLREISNLIL